MKVPYISDSTINSLSSNDVKLLLFFCRHTRRRAFVGADAAHLAMSRRSWSRSADRLVHADLIDYAASSGGYEVRVRLGGRYTWVHHYDDDRLAKATPRANKALLIISRAISNSTKTCRLRVTTLADRLCRSVRTALLALAELRQRMILLSWRTGRSSWFHVPRPEPDPQGRLFEPVIAHRPGLLLRILSLSTPRELTGVLTTLRQRRQAVSDQIRESVIAESSLCPTKTYLRNALRTLGVAWDDANVLCASYTIHELKQALALTVGRHIHNITAYVAAALGRGWCSGRL